MPKPKLGKKKILVIDDEADLCTLVKENLEQTGKFWVVILTNPLEAEAICRKENPDAILLDVVMPERKGTEVVAALKKDEDLQRIPVIIMSGLGEMVYQKKENKWKWLPNKPIVFKRGQVVHEDVPWRAADAYGAENYIAKPFTTQELILAIEETFSEKGID